MIGNAAEITGTGVGAEGLEATVGGVSGQQEGRAENPHGCLQPWLGFYFGRPNKRRRIGGRRRIYVAISAVRRHPELIDQVPFSPISEGSFPFRRQRL